MKVAKIISPNISTSKLSSPRRRLILHERCNSLLHSLKGDTNFSLKFTISKIFRRFKKNPTELPKIEDLEALGYDEEYSRGQRDFIREHLIQQALREYAEEYQIPTTAFEEETDKYAKKLTNKPLIVDYETMSSIPATNVHPIGNNSYRGGYLPNDGLSVQAAKNAGIRCVIDLTDSYAYKERIEDCGLKYMAYDTEDNSKYIADYDNLVFKDYEFVTNRSRIFRFHGTEEEFNQECRLPIENFTKLIKQLNEGFCYMGCSSGTHRTNFVVMLNQAFNPKLNAEGLENYDWRILTSYRHLYEKLTDSDKLTMGWDEEFEKLFLSKIQNGIIRQFGFIPK